MNRLIMFCLIGLVALLSPGDFYAQNPEVNLFKVVKHGSVTYVGNLAAIQPGVVATDTSLPDTTKKLSFWDNRQSRGAVIRPAFDIRDNHIYFTTTEAWERSRSIYLHKLHLEDLSLCNSNQPSKIYRELNKNSLGSYVLPQISLTPLRKIALSRDAKGEQTAMFFDIVMLTNERIKILVSADNVLTISEYDITHWPTADEDPLVLRSSVAFPFTASGPFQASNNASGNCFLAVENGSVYTVSAAGVTEITKVGSGAGGSAIVGQKVLLINDTTSGSVSATSGSSSDNTVAAARVLGGNNALQPLPQDFASGLTTALRALGTAQ